MRWLNSMFNFNVKKNIKLQFSDDKSIEYQLVKKNRKTISMKVTENGLTVNAPLFMTQNRINELLKTKQKWIEKKLSLLLSVPKKFVIKNKNKFKLLGKDIEIFLIKSETLNIILEKDNSIFYYSNSTDDQDKLRVNFKIWIKNKALKYFKLRVKKISMGHDLLPNSVLLSNAKTRWGTCNSKGNLRLNWRLIQTNPTVIDYVICHELAHLKFMNHSNQFWAEVEKLCPNFKVEEKFLKEKGFELYSID